MDTLMTTDFGVYGPEVWSYPETLYLLKEYRKVAVRDACYHGMVYAISSGDVLRSIRSMFMTIGNWEVGSVDSDIDSLDRATGIAMLRKCVEKWIA